MIGVDVRSKRPLLTRSLSMGTALARTNQQMKEMPASLAWLTVGRLTLVPLMILLVDRSTVGMSLALAIFIAADLLDGVVARRLDADDPARRALDSMVDRTAIWAVYSAAVLAGLLPPILFGLLLLRDAYCAYQCGQMFTVREVAIKADWMYRGLNLMLAAWVLAAPSAGPALRVAAFSVILFAAAAVAVDLTRSVAFVLGGSAGRSSEVISATQLRKMRGASAHSETDLLSA